MQKQLLGIIAVNIMLYSSFLTASDWKIQAELYKAIKDDNIEELNSILKKNPSLVNKQIKYHRYPVLDAAFFCSVNAMKMLVKKGADLKKKESQTGNTILHLAVGNLKIKTKKRNAVFEYLINEKKFNIEIKNKNGQTPFNFAFNSNPCAPPFQAGIDVFDMFDKYKANLNAQDASGKTVLNYLVTKFKIDKKDPAKSTLQGPTVAKMLIEKGVDVNIADKDKRTPLISFLSYSQKLPEKMKVDLVTLLMENGAKSKLKSKKGERALKLVKKKGALYKIMKKKYKKK